MNWGFELDAASFSSLAGKRIAVLLALSGWFVAGGSIATAAEKPNVVFILADDLGIGDLGSLNQLARAQAGLPALQTPNLDRLAGQGMTFTQMYSGASYCAPSRTALLTGFQHHHVRVQETSQLTRVRGGDVQDRMWSQMLQDEGYDTSMFGRWHVGTGPSSGTAPFMYSLYGDSTPNQKGFDTVFGTLGGNYRPFWFWADNESGGLSAVPNDPDPSWPGPGHALRFSEDVTAEHAAQYIREHADGANPFAAYFAFYGVHDPIDRYGAADYSEDDWPEIQKNYAGIVTNLDENVGKIIDAIEDPNGDGDTADSIAEDTIIFFASDNGALWTYFYSGYETEFFDSNGPYRGSKGNTLEGGIITPFFVRWDGHVAPGSVNDQHVGSFADVFPTIAELAGGDVPVGLDGTSMVSAIMQGDAGQQTDSHVWTSLNNYRGVENATGYAVRVGDLKLIHHTLTNTDEVYNLALDPYETTDLAPIRNDLRLVLHNVADALGVTQEPFFASTDGTGPANVYYTQYLNWSPADGAEDFAAAANWSGGTAYNYGTDESLYWNTGPGPNWLASLVNHAEGAKLAVLNEYAQVLALEIGADVGSMELVVAAGGQLDAFNGVRLSAGGTLRMQGSMVRTSREIEIRPGGTLVGHGVIGGRADLIAGVAELADQKLFEAHVINNGVVDVDDAGNAGLLLLDGDYTQLAAGRLQLDITGRGSPGAEYDALLVTGDVTLGGEIVVDFGDGFVPAPNDIFTLVAGNSITLEDLHLILPASDLTAELLHLPKTLQLRFVDLSGVAPSDLLSRWSSGFGLTGYATTATGDFTADTRVDGNDFLAWQRQFALPPGQTATTAKVPEPAAWLLAALAAAILGRCRGAHRPSACHTNLATFT